MKWIASALILLSASAAAAQQLLNDAEFAKGFGAAFIYGSEYTGSRRPPMGELTAYRDISPWQVYVIPEGSVNKVGVKMHPWDFQEGLHHNFTHTDGTKVRELHAHRLVVNHVIEENSEERLQFAQFNNFRLPKDHPDRDTKLVKRVTTDRQGNLTIFYNSKNEIRNKATAHSAKWKTDTWPHFLVNQRFLEPIPLADFERLDFSVSYQVNEMTKLSNWPNAIKGAARSGMNLKFMFFLRNPDDLEQKLFVGMMLFTSRENAWTPHLGVEQHGNIFYRDSVSPEASDAPQLGDSRTVEREIRAMVAEALRQGREVQPELSANIDDYAIYNFSIGFEGMGHWQTEAEISGISLLGLPIRPRVEVDLAALTRAKNRIAAKQEPFHSYWNLALADAQLMLSLEPAPSASTDSLQFHHAVKEQGMAARLLAYRWQLDGDDAAGAKAVEILDAWASADPSPGTNFDEQIRYPNGGMDVARGTLPMVAAYDLLHGNPALTKPKQERIENWFRHLAAVIKEGIQRWEENDDFGNQEFQNHHASHVCGLAAIGSALGDYELVQFALDSPENPKDFKELVTGLILMPGDKPKGGLRGKLLHVGELEDRVRTNEGKGLVYCHLSLTLMLYAADVLSRATGEDYLNWEAPGGETLRLPATFYSDYFRLRNAHINDGYYIRDQAGIGNHRQFQGIFEVALGHWPNVPNLKAIVRSMDRAQTPRSWLNYYELPL
ncbi:MAG: alginate lyase family protein, partial [Verrucomicrobiota bacterium]